MGMFPLWGRVNVKSSPNIKKNHVILKNKEDMGFSYFMPYINDDHHRRMIIPGAFMFAQADGYFSTGMEVMVPSQVSTLASASTSSSVNQVDVTFFCSVKNRIPSLPMAWRSPKNDCL